jgi:hypothetical protein
MLRRALNLFIVIITLFSNYNSLNALDNAGIPYAFIKGGIQATKTFGMKKYTNASEIHDVLAEWAINNCLQAQFGRNLCSSGKKKGIFDLHKIISIGMIEVAKLLASKSPQIPKKIVFKKYLINVLKSILSKNGCFGKEYANCRYAANGIGFIISSLNTKFYADFEQGTIDYKELKKAFTKEGGKYRNIQAGCEALAITCVGNKLDVLIPKQLFGKNSPLHKNDDVDQINGKAVGSLIMSFVKPAIKRGISLANNGNG